MPTVKGRSAVKAYIVDAREKLVSKVLVGAGRAAGNVIADSARLRVYADEVREGITVTARRQGGQVVVKVGVKAGWPRSVGIWLEYDTAKHVIRASDDAREGRSIGRMNDLHRKKEGALHFAPTRTEAARDAGMSEHQQKTAVRVAAIPEPDFEAAVESETPPTVTKLADWGRKPQEKPDWLRDMERPKPVGFKSATEFLGKARSLSEFCAANDPIVVAGALEDHERADLRRNVGKIRRWLRTVTPMLKG